MENGGQPLVSVIIPFFNTPPQFIREAVESVLHQTYFSWEILLIDDGSTDASPGIAHEYSDQRPGQIKIFTHPDHGNHDTGASRNLGLAHASGEYVAFLDADDIWYPNKLAEQVALLEKHLEAGMLYGQTEYWYSWTGLPEDLERDYFPVLGVTPNRMIEPPGLLPLLIEGKAAVPCTCSVLARRSAIAETGGFADTFSGLYEDQAFYAQMYLKYPVYVTDRCWDRYRQHPTSHTAIARKTGEEALARVVFLNWLNTYLREHNVRHEGVWQALQRELWRIHYPSWLPNSPSMRSLVRWVKKWLLRLEQRVLPMPVQNWLWRPARGWK